MKCKISCFKEIQMSCFEKVLFSVWLCLAGAWETKVSNREKRQQRKKEKGPGDSSGSPEAGDRASQKVEQPVVTATAGTKKNKGMHFFYFRFFWTHFCADGIQNVNTQGLPLRYKWALALFLWSCRVITCQGCKGRCHHSPR